MNTIWIFNGNTNQFPSAVFTSPTAAEKWIKTHELTGTLTGYPVNTSVYDWAIAQEFFIPRDEHQKTSDFIANFSSAYLEHSHYENGEG